MSDWIDGRRVSEGCGRGEGGCWGGAALTVEVIRPVCINQLLQEVFGRRHGAGGNGKCSTTDCGRTGLKVGLGLHAGDRVRLRYAREPMLSTPSL